MFRFFADVSFKATYIKQLGISLVYLCISSSLQAGAEAYDLINKMSHSHHELNYQGLFSFQQGSELRSLKVTHAVYDGEEFDRLEHMDGEQGDIIRRGHNLKCIHPGRQLVRVLSGINLNENENELKLNPQADRITDFYQFLRVGTSRVAGRNTIEVLLSPRDKHRFSHHLSLDQETGLLLKSVMVGADEEVLEQFQYVDISIGKRVAKSYFETDKQNHQVAHLDPETHSRNTLSLNNERWAVNWVPKGYASVAASDDMVTYTDGLSAFSVFLEAIDQNALTKEGQSQRGATIAYSKPLLLIGRLHRVTVVGEIPKQTAQRVARSVNLLGAPSINKQ